MIKRLSLFLIYIIIITNSGTLLAKVKLPALVSDSMVLQRDVKLKIWGWADNQEKIKITFKGKNYTTKAGADGKWMVWLPATKAGGPYILNIVGEGNSIMLKNILVGDVWMCAGQSNMVHSLDLHKERYEQDITNANYPEIRQFLVPTYPVLHGPADDVPNGSWKAASPKNVLRFSVVAYFFAKNLYDKYKVPIGIINSSVGGSPIEAWISEEGLKEFPAILKTVATNKDSGYVNGINRKASLKNQQIAKSRQSDKGLTGSKKWYDPSYSAVNWNTINIPGYWEDQGVHNLDGVVWYRRELNIPSSMT
nr:sialate O-acetylesterase [Saprospiraceae bacterium]